MTGLRAELWTLAKHHTKTTAKSTVTAMFIRVTNKVKALFSFDGAMQPAYA